MSDLKRKRKLTKKGLILSAACGFLLAAAAGCGKAQEEGLQIEAIGEERDVSEDGAADDTDENAGEDDAVKNADENTGDADQSAGGGAAQSVGNEEIEGEVKRLSEDSFVISKIDTWSEGDASFAVAEAPGYEKEEDRITVRAAQNCAFTYEIVKNGGVNPEDISTREGSFADMKEGLMVIIKGSWQEDGSFLADSIVMEEFV